MPHPTPPIRCLLAIALLVTSTFAGIRSAPAAAQAGYSVLDLGPFVATAEEALTCPDRHGGLANAINAEGVVTGATPWGERTSTAFRATDGKIKRLKGGKGGAAGWDINADGQIAGYVADARDGDPCAYPTTHAATWVGSELQLLPDGGQSSQAIGISDDGLIAGFIQPPPDPTVFTFVATPVVWRNGELAELPLPAEVEGGSGFPIDVSPNGQIVGSVLDADGAPRGDVLWDGDDVSLLPEGFYAVAVNDDGVIVGTTDQGVGAARLVDGELEPLPGIPDDAYRVDIHAMNAAGDVIGVVYAEEGEGPVLWRGDERIDLMTLLPADSDFQWISPEAINDAGMILVGGAMDDGLHYAVLIPDPA